MPTSFTIGRKDVTLDPKHPIHEWRSGDFECALAPVLVCKHPQKTVGLGDSISATGLLYQDPKW